MLSNGERWRTEILPFIVFASVGPVSLFAEKVVLYKERGRVAATRAKTWGKHSGR